MKSLKLRSTLLCFSRNEGRRRPNSGFRLFSAAAGGETITDILEREYRDPSASPARSFLNVDFDPEKASAVPESRKAFVKETMLAINAIMRQCRDESTSPIYAEAPEQAGVQSSPRVQVPDHDDPAMRSSFGVYRLLLAICNLRSWIERDTEMKKYQLVLRPTQVAWVLRVQKESSRAWDFFSWAAHRTGYVHDQHCFAIMVDVLGRSSDYARLENLLSEMDRQQVPHNVGTLNQLIEIFAVKGDAERAEHFYTKLKDLDGQPNVHVVKHMLEVFLRAGQCEKALEILPVIHEGSMLVDTECYNRILEGLSRNGMVEAVWDVYNGMKQYGAVADTSTYGILLCALGRTGRAMKAMQLWAEMVQQGRKPNRDSYNGILDALAGESNWGMGISFFKRMVEEGIDPDFSSCEAVSKLLLKAGQAGRTLELVRFSKDKSVKIKVYEGFVRTLGSAGCAEEVFVLVNGMKADGIIPSEATYLSVIDVLCSTAAEPDDVMTVVEAMEKECGSLSLESFNSILTSLCCSGRFQLAYNVLKECHRRGLSPDAELSNTIFVGLATCGKWQLTEGIFDELNVVGSRVKVMTFNTMLRSSAQVGDVETTKRILQIMETKAVIPNVDTYNAAIACFSKAGRLNVALEVFNEMRTNGCIPNTNSYNSVLLILRKAGLTDAVISFFGRMQADGIVPDALTCSILSDIDENCAKLSRLFLARDAQKAAMAMG